jgi:hypothetical protein
MPASGTEIGSNAKDATGKMVAAKSPKIKIHRLFFIVHLKYFA